MLHSGRMVEILEGRNCEGLGIVPVLVVKIVLELR
jgi:hypothetical protein